MSKPTASQVAELRGITSAGMNDCRNALIETSCDMEKAIQYLREKGIASAAKRVDRAAKQGLVHSYIHGAGTLGVLVEVNCETDFVARTENFQKLAKEIAMQVAAMAPLYVKREDVPQDLINSETEIYKAQLKEEGKPEKVWDKIISGKLDKFYSQICLMEQLYMKDMEGKQTIKDLLTEAIATIGENIVVRRFSRFKLGE
jgi:elongation factor Ts